MKVISFEFRTFVIKLQFKTVLSDHSKMCNKPYPSNLQNNIAHIDYKFLSTYISTYMYRVYQKNSNRAFIIIIFPIRTISKSI